MERVRLKLRLADLCNAFVVLSFRGLPNSVNVTHGEARVLGAHARVGMQQDAQRSSMHGVGRSEKILKGAETDALGQVKLALLLVPHGGTL